MCKDFFLQRRNLLRRPLPLLQTRKSPQVLCLQRSGYSCCSPAEAGRSQQGRKDHHRLPPCWISVVIGFENVVVGAI